MTLQRKRRKRRAPGTGCTIPRCRRLRYTEVDGKGMCAKHAADSLFAKMVRDSMGGSCWAFLAGAEDIGCNGQIQCCHIIRRGYLATRWMSENAVPMCAAHHVYYTHRPLEWEVLWGEVWTQLRKIALESPPERPEDVIERLRSAA